MKCLTSVTKQEQVDFFNSFDQVLCDVDGVLWMLLETIPGTQKGIQALQKLGKQVTFVSNNATKSINFYHNQLTTAGFQLDKEDLITPALAMVHHLKKKNFTKEIFVIGSEALKKGLERGGFKVAQPGPDRIKESLQELARCALIDNEDVGAVILDADINKNYVEMQMAVTYLKRPEVLFIKGAPDRKLPVGKSHVLIGPGYFYDIIEDVSGRKALSMAKPSLNFNDYIVEKLKIKDPSRVLFIGDSIAEDMAFAANAGYKRLLVLSGLTKMDSIKDWKFPEEYKPDFYVDSLKTIGDIVATNFENKL